ncbi:hypothetical protein AB0H73_27400 [Streptomyces olivoreticuli]
MPPGLATRLGPVLFPARPRAWHLVVGHGGEPAGFAVGRGRKPLFIVVAAGQRGDSPEFAPVLEDIRVP